LTRIVRLPPVPAGPGGVRSRAELRPFACLLSRDWSVIGPGCQPFLPHLLAFRQYRYRDSNCVASPANPVLTRDSGTVSPAGGRWGRPETGQAAPKIAASFARSRVEIRDAAALGVPPEVVHRIEDSAWGTIPRWPQPLSTSDCRAAGRRVAVATSAVWLLAFRCESVAGPGGHACSVGRKQQPGGACSIRGRVPLSERCGSPPAARCPFRRQSGSRY
jgi:hypothetical protein